MQLSLFILISVFSKLSAISNAFWIFILPVPGLISLLLLFLSLKKNEKQFQFSKIIVLFEKLLPTFVIMFAISFVILQLHNGLLWSRIFNYVNDFYPNGFAVFSVIAFFLVIVFLYGFVISKNTSNQRLNVISLIGLLVSSLFLIYSLLVSNFWLENPQNVFFNSEINKFDVADVYSVIFNVAVINKFIFLIFSSLLMIFSFFIFLAAISTMQKKMIDVDNQQVISVSVLAIVSIAFILVSGRAILVDKAENQPVNFALLTSVADDDSNYESRRIKNISEYSSSSSISSYLFLYDSDAYVPSINDFYYGNYAQGIISFDEKIERGKYAKKIINQDVYKSNFDIRPNIKDSILSLSSNSEYEYYYNYFQYLPYADFKSSEDVTPSSLFTFSCFVIGLLSGFLLLCILVFLFLKMKLKNTRINKFSNVVAILTFPLFIVSFAANLLLPKIIYANWAVYEIIPISAIEATYENDGMRLMLILLFVFVVFMLTICISRFLRILNKSLVDKSV